MDADYEGVVNDPVFQEPVLASKTGSAEFLLPIGKRVQFQLTTSTKISFGMRWHVQFENLSHPEQPFSVHGDDLSGLREYSIMQYVNGVMEEAELTESTHLTLAKWWIEVPSGGEGTPDADTDSDKMPDEWEIKHALDYTDSRDAALDPNLHS